MTPQIAAAVFLLGILGLFALNREPKVKTSIALWLPVIWLCIAGSRMVSQWLNLQPLGAANDATAYLEGNPLDRNILSALVALAIITLISRGPRIIRVLRANWPIVLYYSYGLISIAWSDFPDVAFKHWIKALGDFVMILVVWTELNPTAAVRRLLARVGFFLMPVSILFIKYYGDIGRSYDPGPGFWLQVYTGVTTTKNLLGMITLICGVAAVWRVLQELRRLKERKFGPLMAQAAILAMVAWLLWKAQSMTSIACFCLACGLMVMMSIRPFIRRPVIMHVMVAVILAACVSTLFLNLGSGMLESVGRDPTLTGRTDIWKLVISLAKDPLVGTGFESFWLGSRLDKIWAVYWWHPNEAHDGYLEVYLNLGWVGVILLGMVIVMGYRNVVLTFRRDPDAGRLRLAYFVSALTYNFTESAFRMMHPIWIIFLLSAVAVPETKMRAKAKTKVTVQATSLPPVPLLEEA